ncbi:hypothetical protein Egran_03759 [Elaphomyces granulatus]|uniref:CRAL-TRIO domain-containing protein n=1 Tax=Elaphomyces granulatus TaxID=519963 RepID=A0A232LWS7_9EURO|nr:hypothetical protein Egran_03759 [Elaphomyces granulatus]
MGGPSIWRTWGRSTLPPSTRSQPPNECSRILLQNLACEYEKVADSRLLACSRKAGILETCCTIMDLKGVGLTSVPSVYGYLSQASAVSQNYYPERPGKLYLINAPWGFSSVFSVVKTFLDPVTVDKIHVLGTNYQKELLNQLSDMGPWKEKEWARPPKWLVPKEKNGEAEAEDEDVEGAAEDKDAGIENLEGRPEKGNDDVIGFGAKAAA